jgi:hypothetical protein
MDALVSSKKNLESDIYTDPKIAFKAVINRLSLGLESELKEQLDAYVRQVVDSENPKNPAHQLALKPILEAFLENGKREEAGLLLNIHRTLTEFSGYGANSQASSDVEACFGGDMEIPETGVVVVDFFVTQNLPKVLEICKQKGVDLRRIKVCVPKAILAVQLMKLSPEKRQKFEEACAQLSEDQFLLSDVNHSGDIQIDEPVAIWFSPRTTSIYPRLHAETEGETIENYRSFFAERAKQVIVGGRIYANVAYSEEFESLEVVEAKDRKTGELQIKLTGMSRNVADAVMKLLLNEQQFEYIGKGEFDPKDVSPNIDHHKLAKELHVRKVV